MLDCCRSPCSDFIDSENNYSSITELDDADELELFDEELNELLVDTDWLLELDDDWLEPPELDDDKLDALESLLLLLKSRTSELLLDDELEL